MPMLETRSGGAKEGLNKLGLSKFAEESKSIASNVLIRVLEIIPDAITIDWSVLSWKRDIRLSTKPKSSPA